MSPGFQTLLVCVVFTAQLAVLSFLVPRSFRRSFAMLLDRYPPERYTRLYPVPPARLMRANAALQVINVLTGGGGALVLAWGLLQRVDPLALSRWMVWTCCVQMLPAVLRMLWQMRIGSALRAMPAPALRTAELRSWQVRDFVAPSLVAAALVTMAAAVLCSAAAMYRGAPANPAMPVYTLVISVLLLIRMTVVLSRRAPMPRSDPYMSAADLFRSRRTRLRLLFGGGGLLGLYFIAMLAWYPHEAPLPPPYVAIGVSLACQLIYLLAARQARSNLATRELDSYKEDAA